jgi:hypothetical protein
METESLEQVAAEVRAASLRCRRGCGVRPGAGELGEGGTAGVGVGPGVLAELMEEEVDEVVGLKGKHDPGRPCVTGTSRAS